jgi:hypothetical protein
MTISNVNNNLNTYLYSSLGEDLQTLVTQARKEISEVEAIEVPKPAQSSIQGPREIKDEYIPSIKPKVEVTLEERLSQVISPEEMKDLLTMLMRVPRIYEPGQLVDVKG